jgi:hypothetical protein
MDCDSLLVLSGQMNSLTMLEQYFCLIGGEYRRKHRNEARQMMWLDSREYCWVMTYLGTPSR